MTPTWSNPSFDTSSGRFPDLSVKEDLTPGSNITTLAATDDDTGEDGDVTYQILSTTDSELIVVVKLLHTNHM